MDLSTKKTFFPWLADLKLSRNYIGFALCVQCRISAAQWAIADSLTFIRNGGPDTCYQNFDPPPGFPALVAQRLIHKAEHFTVAQRTSFRHTLNPYSGQSNSTTLLRTDRDQCCFPFCISKGTEINNLSFERRICVGINSQLGESFWFRKSSKCSSLFLDLKRILFVFLRTNSFWFYYPNTVMLKISSFDFLCIFWSFPESLYKIVFVCVCKQNPLSSHLQNEKKKKSKKKKKQIFTQWLCTMSIQSFVENRKNWITENRM